jgi:D-alanine-D-alanine ligase
MTLPPVDPQWWQTLFDELYLLTDARSVQDQAVTGQEVDALIAALDLRPHEVILDLCGGHGRHALELARRGFARITVLDFSASLVHHGLAQARREGLPVAFVRADARAAPLAGAAFDAAALLANSFGYGAMPEDDVQILREAWRVLKPGGRLFMEVADPDYVRRHLPRQSWHEAGDLVICRQRWPGDDALVCREMVLCRRQGLLRDRTYQMRLYEPAALAQCLQQAGFDQVHAASPAGAASESERGSLTRRLALAARK